MMVSFPVFMFLAYSRCILSSISMKKVWSASLAVKPQLSQFTLSVLGDICVYRLTLWSPAPVLSPPLGLSLTVHAAVSSMASASVVSIENFLIAVYFKKCCRTS